MTTIPDNLAIARQGMDELSLLDPDFVIPYGRLCFRVGL